MESKYLRTYWSDSPRMGDHWYLRSDYLDEEHGDLSAMHAVIYMDDSKYILDFGIRADGSHLTFDTLEEAQACAELRYAADHQD